ncbi:hypothetical protein GCM10010129_55070 [Streptomyces fumigatiscleroticus]|nr:hypothetical protein GCM10010129_55070 [Streptomyces fumigatiscleroticus]
MSEIAGRTTLRQGATAVVHESYSFACMRCGHGWEQAYEIEHHRDAEGQEFVLYVADGRIVPSPLSRPACENCDNHVVRIMRAGRVASARDAAHRPHQAAPGQAAPGQAAEAGTPAAGPVEVPEPAAEAAPAKQPADHHWHLSDLLHPFHRRAS